MRLRRAEHPGQPLAVVFSGEGGGESEFAIVGELLRVERAGRVFDDIDVGLELLGLATSAQLACNAQLFVGFQESRTALESRSPVSMS